MSHSVNGNQDIAVVIPAYNEEKTVVRITLDAQKYISRVIVVDDGSTDRTGELLISQPVTLLSNSGNMGKAFSLWRGMQFAVKNGAKAVITLDGDCQHHAADIPRLVSSWRNNPDCIVIAARLNNRNHAPWMRRFANSFADFWVSWASGYPVRDSQSGFRLYPTSLIQQLDPITTPERSFVFESEILIDAAAIGIRSISVPIDTVYHDNARKSHYRPATDTTRIIKMIANKLLRRKLYLSGLINVLTSGKWRWT